jgi:hypothetical protein
MRRRGWIVATGLLLVWTAAIVVWDGIYVEWRGWRFSSRNPVRPFLAAALVSAFAVWRHGRDGVRRDLADWRFDVERWGAVCAAAIALVILAVGLVWGTHVAGGADSYGYVSQSRLWAQGNLVVAQPIAAKVPWPAADWTFAPLGYKPTAAGGAIVPIYAPGLPMLMALLSLIHPDGVFWVVPLAGASLIALSFFLGRAFGGYGAGLLTAALVATSPAFLFQLVAPMSDVVVAAFWVAALVVAIPNRVERWLGAGLLSSFAILTRPNTAPIAVVFILAALWRDKSAGCRGGEYRRRLLSALAFATGATPGVLSVAAIHTALYGSPLESGYGAAADLYAFANLAPNLARYSTWLVTTETPFVCLAVAAPFVVSNCTRRRWLAAFTALCAAATWLCYLFYQPFEVWWYLRFLLTSFPCLLALAAATFTGLMRRIAVEWRMPLAVAVLTPVLMWRIDYAIDRRTFDSWRLERRYADTGRLVADRLAPNAVFFSGQQSGSLRYYSGRLTLRWNHLDAAWLERSIDVLKGLGFRPYFVFEEGEEAEFRGWFGSTSRLGRLDWPPLVELKTAPVVRIYDPDQAGK